MITLSEGNNNRAETYARPHKMIYITDIPILVFRGNILYTKYINATEINEEEIFASILKGEILVSR